MKTGEAGLELIRKFEGCRLQAYQDSVGIWTIGYGCTTDVEPGQIITQAEAEQRLMEDLRDAETCVSAAVTVPLTEHEFDALVAFVFNLGCKQFRGSTLLRKLNASDYNGAALEFRRWDKAGGQVLAGLTRRMAAEERLFETA